MQYSPFPKKTVSKGSILDTDAQRLDLSNILPTYLDKFHLELLSAYLIWLDTRDPVKAIPDENPAIRVTKAIMLTQIGEALRDEVFCEVMLRQLEELYGHYDEKYGPKV